MPEVGTRIKFERKEIQVFMTLPESPIKPVLSLCLPTYNRCSLLRGALETMCAQITPSIASQVEIVVSDNASPDNTPAVVRDIMQTHSGVAIRYHRQEQNLGTDGNIQTLMHMAQGEFVYLLSDDDLLLPNAIAKVLELITDHPELDAFALNIRPFINSVDEPTKAFFDVTEDKIITNFDEAFLLTDILITFLSVFVFRRSAAARDYTPNMGTCIVQTYYMVDVLARQRGMYVTCAPYLGLRANNMAGYNFFRVYATYLPDLMRYAVEQGLSPATRHKMLAKHLRTHMYPSIFQLKLTGKLGGLQLNYAEGLRRLLPTYGNDIFLWTRLIPLILTPRPLVRPVFTLLQQSKRLIGKTPLPLPYSE